MRCRRGADSAAAILVDVIVLLMLELEAPVASFI
jgi:hypothetical protein